MTITVEAALLLPVNKPPVVTAGGDFKLSPEGTTTTISLIATVSDDALPNDAGGVTVAWSKVSGPAAVTFGDPSALSTTATFTTIGIYVLRLTATDGELTVFDDLTITFARVYGDASLSGTSGMEDLTLVIDWLIGRIAMPADGDNAYVAADVNGDGSINLADLHWMVMWLIGRITEFPAEL